MKTEPIIEFFWPTRNKLLLTVLLAIITAFSVPLFPCTFHYVLFADPGGAHTWDGYGVATFALAIGIQVSSAFAQTCTSVGLAPFYLILLPYLLVSTIDAFWKKRFRTQRNLSK